MCKDVIVGSPFAFTGRMDGIDYMHTIVNEVYEYILKCENVRLASGCVKSVR